MSASPVVVFLSTGRCGTQWLTETLRELYPRGPRVEHEPIGPLYRPRRHFRSYDRPHAILEVRDVREHVAAIARGGHYVETGWPAFAAIPCLASVLGERLRVVHLTRHPVPTALSHLAHSSYAGSARDDAYTRLATLGPTDPNVFQPDYAERWDDLSPYAKCLFWCTEVHLFGLELPERLPEVPLLRVRAEDLLSGDRAALDALVAHLGLPADARWAERTSRRVDRWRHRTDREVDPLEVREHPTAMDVMRRLGYTVEELDLGALSARYSGDPDPGLDRVGRFGDRM